MEVARIDERAVHGLIARGDLPFGLGRKAGAGPARERVGLVVAHVTHRRAGIDRIHAGERELGPTVRGALPVERRFPVAGAHRRPTVRQPQLGAMVAAVVDEREPIGVRHEAVGETELVDEHAMRGRLVVEREARRRRDRCDGSPPRRTPSSSRRSRATIATRRRIRGTQRIHPEHVLDVGEHQLLVLLLVVQPELDHRQRRMIRVVADALDQRLQRAVDVRAVREHLGDRGPRDETALRATVTLARLHVVRVEEERVLRVRRDVGRVERREHERLEEPTRVREMPLRRAHVGHRADDVVLDLERRAECFRLRAHPDHAVEKRRRRGADVGDRHAGQTPKIPFYRAEKPLKGVRRPQSSRFQRRRAVMSVAISSGRGLMKSRRTRPSGNVLTVAGMRAVREHPSRRQDDRVGRPPEAPVPDELVSRELVARRVGVRLEHANPDRFAGLHRRETKHHDLEIRRDVAHGELRSSDRLALENLELELLAGVEIHGTRIRDRAAGPHLVEVSASSGPRFRVVVVQIERVRLGLLEEVDDLAILVRAVAQLRRDARRRGARHRSSRRAPRAS